MKLKFKLRYLFFKYFPKQFLKFYRKIYEHRLNFNLLDLIKKGVEINVIYDIGAFRGTWSDFLSKTSLKNKNFYLFEANNENEEYLRKFNFKYFLGILSDKKKNVEFYSRKDTGDSYFKEQTNLYKKDMKPLLKETVTLDEIVEKNNLPLPDFIKIDTQGSELDILKGSQKSISNCSIIYLECPIIEYNTRAPNLNDYIKYLNSINFLPYDVCEVHRIDNVLIQIDILFVKRSILNKIYTDKKMLNILNWSI